MLTRLAVVGLSLTASNFVYQAAVGQNWGDAVERSVFQIVALAIAAIVILTEPSERLR